MKTFSLFNGLLLGEWRARFVQVAVTVIAIAVGVALGFSIYLINTAAFNEFSAASKSLSGQSDLQIIGKQELFDESLYPKLAQYEGIEVASPVLEFAAVVPDKLEQKNDHKLKILGIDVFRAAEISPDLLGVPAEDRLMDGLSDEAIFLSPAAMEWLQVKQGDTVRFNVGMQTISLRVAGGLTRARAGQRIGIMDIGAAQWRFQYLGLLSRIDLKLAAGIHHEALSTKLEQALGSQYHVAEIADQEARVSNMSRAYRVNLNMLALVALFTGAFLVFSTQALSVIRRRSQLALLRVLGFTRQQLLRLIIIEGAVLGVMGSLLGLLLGYGFAVLAIKWLGGDLGSGFFPGIQPALYLSPQAVGVFLMTGLAVSLLGSIAPALEAARAKPAVALKSGDKERSINRLSKPWPALVCLFVGGLLTQLPPIYELPVFGYFAIALLLIGGIALMPSFASWVFAFLLRVVNDLIARGASGAVTLMAFARLANAPHQASIALGGILASFSLVVAMAVMVLSFRVSVDNWLDHVLPADLYVRAADSGNKGGIHPEAQKAMTELSGFERVDFFRVQPLILDPERPEITLFARPIDRVDPRNTLPLIKGSITPAQLPEGSRPVWVSEAMVDLYGYTVGNEVMIPFGESQYTFTVAGIWRDYGRQFGAMQIQLSDYRELSGDFSINTAAIWLQSQTPMAEAYRVLRQLPFSEALDITQSQNIRANSLEIFDRSFAVTYVLEIVAVIIGLLGVATSFSAQTLARAKEFGMLRHVGVTRRQIFAMLVTEGSLLTVLGIALGFAIGGVISLILIFIVNPQSFHWTMQLYIPWGWLMLIAFIMLISASVTALVAGRQAVSDSVIRTVREDW